MATAATQRLEILEQQFHNRISHEEQHIAIVDTRKKYIPRDVNSSLNYFIDPEDGSPPAPAYMHKPETFNRPLIAKEVTVHDIRGSEDQYSLDKTGFQVVKHESREKDFIDDDQIKRVYYAETEELLKKSTGASKVFIFDHTIRRQPPRPKPSSSNPTAASSTPSPARAPVQQVHIDQSYDAGPNRVRHHLGDLAPTLLKTRYQIINVWRPIKPILKDPLAVADARSIAEEDLVVIKLIYPDREGETFSVRPGKGDGHQWHYLFGQETDEVMLIKCFDSKKDGRARRAPHSAFVDDEWEGEATRESIEVRALVFHEDDFE